MFHAFCCGDESFLKVDLGGWLAGFGLFVWLMFWGKWPMRQGFSCWLRCWGLRHAFLSATQRGGGRASKCHRQRIPRSSGGVSLCKNKFLVARKHHSVEQE